MCFHNALSKTATEIESRFEARFIDKTVFKPIYHGSGFSFMKWPIITQQSPDIIELFNWGLIPFWIKNCDEAKNIRSLTLNAKGETIFDKPSFQHSISSKRCLVLSSGFFEWQHKQGKKIPYFIFLKNKAIMAMGGLYSEWTDLQSGEIQYTFSIITTVANPLMGTIHNTKKRMPLILSSIEEKKWLDESMTADHIRKLIKPYEEDNLEAYTVGKLISSQNKNRNVPEVQNFYNYEEQVSLF